MMKLIEVLRGCGASGVSLRPGEVVGVSGEDARILVALGKARMATPIEAREPVAETRDPEPVGLETGSAEALIEKPRRKAR
jgi:hypothetical protein